MSKPRLLDLFCGAGGAAEGYIRAGWDVTGVDIRHQSHYPGRMFLAWDAIKMLGVQRTYHMMGLPKFDAIHASPPCQAYCAPTQYNGNRDTYPDLVGPVRDQLLALGLPFIIENVPGAPLIDPVVLCGPMFGLPIYRHRLFESNISLTVPEHPKHVARCSRNGRLPDEGQFMTITGGRHSKAWTVAAAKAMGVEWMETTREVCEAIPPAYTEYIGKQLLAHVEARRAA